jgi:hypothetical protein
VISSARAQALAERLWAIESCADLRPLVEAMAKPDDGRRATA